MAKRNPEQTRERILEAAVAEFAENGFGGARVDAIAERALANKRMIYHYFGNKEDLFVAVMERAYEQIRRHEIELDLQHRDPEQGIRELVRFTFQYFLDHPEFIRLLNNENLYEARHVRRSTRIPELHSPLVDQLDMVLRRGESMGEFRPGVEPVQLYISIASLGYFYLSNAATLGTIFNRNLKTKAALDERLEHITQVVLGYLRPDGAGSP
ncbi:MAG: TetR family transcriptional regulator [Rhodobacterales bacterium]|nr:TetR family transcriptional regulator [Rhodobacterales bacterium]